MAKNRNPYKKAAVIFPDERLFEEFQKLCDEDSRTMSSKILLLIQDELESQGRYCGRKSTKPAKEKLGQRTDPEKAIDAVKELIKELKDFTLRLEGIKKYGGQSDDWISAILMDEFFQILLHFVV